MEGCPPLATHHRGRTGYETRAARFVNRVSYFLSFAIGGTGSSRRGCQQPINLLGGETGTLIELLQLLTMVIRHWPKTARRLHFIVCTYPMGSVPCANNPVNARSSPCAP